MKRAVLVGALVATASCARILGFEEDRLADEASGGHTSELGGRSGEASKGGQGASGGAATTAGSGGEDSRGGSGGHDTRAGSGGSSSGGTAGSNTGGTGAVTAGSAGVPVGSGGQGEVAGAGGAGGSEEPCAGKAGPDMVRVGSYCIDATEVTNAHYDEFVLDAVPPSTVAGCEWKQSFARPLPDPGSEDLPVGFVDWCDAKAYCQWAGKRLCGRVGEGADPPNSDSYVNSPDLDEWYRVCSDGGRLRYSYGQTYDPSQCNSESTSMRPVGTTPTCTAYHGRVFDLLGNTWEWVAACEASTPSTAQKIGCRHRGGSHGFGEKDCLTAGAQPRDFAALDVGFRCCSD